MPRMRHVTFKCYISVPPVFDSAAAPSSSPPFSASPDAGAAKRYTLALICGGPSRERGISLNSARSALDHLSGPDVDIAAFYMDGTGKFYRIENGMLYSNTPSDFDFKIARDHEPLSAEGLIRALRGCDFALPVIHGAFGEDGELQTLLEKHDIPFIGSSAGACKSMFHKFRSAKMMEQAGMDVIPSLLLTAENSEGESADQERVTAFLEEHNAKKAVLKPASSGSSVGVTVVKNTDDVLRALPEVTALDPQGEAVLEPFCEGTEFSVAVLQSADGEPVALIPSSVRLSYAEDGFFDFRKKYLPTEGTRWPCPADVPDTALTAIRAGAERVFRLFGMRDYVRIDGWALKDGRIVFSDINPVSGMEQNSFLFQQASRAGLTHRETLRFICGRAFGYSPPPARKNGDDRREVFVLAGGDTAERQVSLMSGTNVWLKLRASEQYAPSLFFLNGDKRVRALPYAYALSHTTEETEANCADAHAIETRVEAQAQDIRRRLGASPYAPELPESMTIDAFIAEAAKRNAFVFIALHGGFGENGELQRALSRAHVPYNGSGATASALCMDKARSGAVINDLNDPLLNACRKYCLEPSDLTAIADNSEKALKLYRAIVSACGEGFIIKPRFDGCSAGVVRISGPEDLRMYARVARGGLRSVAAGTFAGQKNIIEFSGKQDASYIAEPYIGVDGISAENGRLTRIKKTGYLEMTVGVTEKNGVYTAMPPSIAVAETEILSLEEKFQGGTGVNITPPPEEIMRAEDTARVQKAVERAARALGISNYARIDIFYNTDTRVTTVIEANTLPGLTPSTVIYHQALAENPPLPPRALLERIISSAE